jgi:hypothetical protein
MEVIEFYNWCNNNLVDFEEYDISLIPYSFIEGLRCKYRALQLTEKNTNFYDYVICNFIG